MGVDGDVTHTNIYILLFPFMSNGKRKKKKSSVIFKFCSLIINVIINAKKRLVEMGRRSFKIGIARWHAPVSASPLKRIVGRDSPSPTHLSGF